MPKVTTNTGTNASAIRVTRLKPNYPALCFIALMKVRSQERLDASLSFHYLLSLVYSLLEAFSNAPEGGSTPKSTHSIIGLGLVPCWHLWTILGNSVPQPISVTNRYWLMTSESRACSWLATAKYTLNRILNMTALSLLYFALHCFLTRLLPVSFLSGHLSLPSYHNHPTFSIIGCTLRWYFLEEYWPL